jgi:hypothetical protein
MGKLDLTRTPATISTMKKPSGAYVLPDQSYSYQLLTDVE